MTMRWNTRVPNPDVTERGTDNSQTSENWEDGAGNGPRHDSSQASLIFAYHPEYSQHSPVECTTVTDFPPMSNLLKNY